MRAFRAVYAFGDDPEDNEQKPVTPLPTWNAIEPDSMSILNNKEHNVLGNDTGTDLKPDRIIANNQFSLSDLQSKSMDQLHMVQQFKASLYSSQLKQERNGKPSNQDSSNDISEITVKSNDDQFLPKHRRGTMLQKEPVDFSDESFDCIISLLLGSCYRGMSTVNAEHYLTRMLRHLDQLFTLYYTMETNILNDIKLKPAHEVLKAGIHRFLRQSESLKPSSFRKSASIKEQCSQNLHASILSLSKQWQMLEADKASVPLVIRQLKVGILASEISQIAQSTQIVLPPIQSWYRKIIVQPPSSLSHAYLVTAIFCILCAFLLLIFQLVTTISLHIVLPVVSVLDIGLIISIILLSWTTYEASTTSRRQLRQIYWLQAVGLQTFHVSSDPPLGLARMEGDELVRSINSALDSVISAQGIFNDGSSSTVSSIAGSYKESFTPFTASVSTYHMDATMGGGSLLQEDGNWFPNDLPGIGIAGTTAAQSTGPTHRSGGFGMPGSLNIEKIRQRYPYGVMLLPLSATNLGMSLNLNGTSQSSQWVTMDARAFDHHAILVGIDFNGCVNFWNPSASEITGRDPNKVLGQSIDTFAELPVNLWSQRSRFVSHHKVSIGFRTFSSGTVSADVSLREVRDVATNKLVGHMLVGRCDDKALGFVEAQLHAHHHAALTSKMNQVTETLSQIKSVDPSLIKSFQTLRTHTDIVSQHIHQLDIPLLQKNARETITGWEWTTAHRLAQTVNTFYPSIHISSLPPWSSGSVAIPPMLHKLLQRLFQRTQRQVSISISFEQFPTTERWFVILLKGMSLSERNQTQFINIATKCSTIADVSDKEIKLWVPCIVTNRFDINALIIAKKQHRSFQSTLSKSDACRFTRGNTDQTTLESSVSQLSTHPFGSIPGPNKPLSLTIPSLKRVTKSSELTRTILCLFDPVDAFNLSTLLHFYEGITLCVCSSLEEVEQRLDSAEVVIVSICHAHFIRTSNHFTQRSPFSPAPLILPVEDQFTLYSSNMSDPQHPLPVLVEQPSVSAPIFGDIPRQLSPRSDRTPELTDSVPMLTLQPYHSGFMPLTDSISQIISEQQQQSDAISSRNAQNRYSFDMLTIPKPFALDVLDDVMRIAMVEVEAKRKRVAELRRRNSIYQNNRLSILWRTIGILGKGTSATCYEVECLVTCGRLAVKLFYFSEQQKQQSGPHQSPAQGGGGGYTGGSPQVSSSISQCELDEFIVSEQNVEILDELDLSVSLHHPNIVCYLGAQLMPTGLAIILELCNGSLADLQKRVEPKVLRDLVPQIAQQCLSALEYLHQQNIIHRDVKPGNLLLKGNLVKFADFGTAIRLQGNVSDMQGTLRFMAPEVYRAIPYGCACDIWSLGCTLCSLCNTEPEFMLRDNHHLLSSLVDPVSLPHSLNNPSQVVPRVAQLIRRCLVVDPKHRSNASDLLSLLKDSIINESNLSDLI